MDVMGARIDRRRLVTGTAGAVAAACVGTQVAGVAEADAARRLRRVLPAPNPIPGGIDLGGGSFIHTFAPGDPAVTLPFTGFTLGGFDVEPGTIGDFDGSSAVAFHVGSARGSDGRTYDLETDVRAFEGRYVVDGVTHRGAFAFV